jgi:RAB protein geranylgeranyltransferase component A
MKMDLVLSEELFKNAPALNLSEKGHGNEATPKIEKDVEDMVSEKCLALMEKNRRMKFSEAMSQVFEADAELKKAYESKGVKNV